MLSALHPLPKLGLCLLWIVASLLVFALQFQIATFLLAFGLLWLGERVALCKLLALMVPFALFGFGFFTTSVLFNREAGFALQMAREQGAAEPDLAPGLVLFMRVLACGMVAALFAQTTDPGQLVRALMLHLQLPAPVGYAVLQAMHLVPDLGREMQMLRMARAMRLGRPVSRLPGPAEMGALLIPLLAFAIRRATRAAIAMEARGLLPEGPRSHLSQSPLRRNDLIAAGAGTLGLVALVMAA